MSEAQKQEQEVFAKVSEEEAKEMSHLVADSNAWKAVMNHALMESAKMNAQVRMKTRDFWLRMYQKYKLDPDKLYTLKIAEREVVLSKQQAQPQVVAAPKK